MGWQDDAVVSAPEWKKDEVVTPKEDSNMLGDVATFMGRRIAGGPLGELGYRLQEFSSDLLNRAAYKAGGAVTDVAAQDKVFKNIAPELGLAANVGVQAIPALAAGPAAAKAASPAIESVSRWLMSSALKPTYQQLRTGKAARAIETMLEEGVNATPGGVAKLKQKIGEINQQVTELVESSPATINKAKLADSIREPLKKFAQQVNPNADMAAIRSAWEEFYSHPLLVNLDEIPARIAQLLKQGTYKVLGEKAYGELKSASVEAQKGIARGLKEGISEAVPGVAKLNKQESELINALNVAERRTLMDMNKNPGGLALLANNPAGFAAFMADKSALFKSIVARMLNAGSEQLPATAGRVVGGAAGAYSGQEP